MNGYTVFLGPFAGIMIADYYIVHRCKVDVPAMYDPHGRYRYISGVVSPSSIHQPTSTYSYHFSAFCRTGEQLWRWS